MNTGRLIGYARVSTDDQILDSQIKVLTDAGVPRENIFEEHASGGRMDRKILRQVLVSLYRGDTLVIVKLDRLARSLKGLIETLEYLDAKGCNLWIVRDGIDTNTIGGRLVFQIMGAIAEFERNLISERTKMGIAAKKSKNVDWRPGPAHSIANNPKRLARWFEMQERGLIFVDGTPDRLSARQVTDELNRADPRAKKITSPQTYRKWKYEGFPGVDVNVEEPLNLPKPEDRG